MNYVIERKINIFLTLCNMIDNNKEISLFDLNVKRYKIHNPIYYFNRVDVLVSDSLSLVYKENKGILFKNMSSFIEYAEHKNLILTENILKLTLLKCGYKSNHTTFRNSFIRNRKQLLQFISIANFKGDSHE